MRFRETIELSHPIEEVKRAYGRRAFFVDRYRGLGFTNLEIDGDGGDGESDYRIRFSAEQKTEIPLPGFAKKVFGETQHVQQEERWDLAHGTGRIETTPRGAPISIHADVRMLESGGGTRLEMDWEVNAKIPLIGGKIEKLAAQEIRARMPKDEALSERLIRDSAEA